MKHVTFRNRLADSAPPAALLIPCLLVCLSCATPFPFDKLEEGLSAETVLTELGPPEAIQVGLGDAGPCWCYVHEKQMWTNTIFFPITPFMIPFMKTWSDAYFTREEVVLHFEEEKLVRWNLRGRNIWSPLTIAHTYAHYSNPYEPACEWERATVEGVVKPGDHLYVARDGVSFWMEPTASSENRGAVARGQPMTLLGKRCGWCHVEDDFGARGWITCVFLDAEASKHQ